MDTQKIIIDNQEVEVYPTIDDEAIEDNSDLIDNNDINDDTINIEEIIKTINGGDSNEWY